MPAGWVAGAAAIGGAVLSSNASNKASKAQQDAANTSTGLARQQYSDTVDRNRPFYDAGTSALATLQQKLPELNSGYDPSKLTSEPGYQFGLQQGQQALERSLAARGRGVSGAALKAASEFGTNYGTTKLNDAFQRDQSSKQQQFSQLQALTNIGQASGNNSSAAGQAFANSAGANAIGAGDSAGANAMAQGNIWGGLLNQGASAYGRSTAGGGGGQPTYGGAPGGATGIGNGVDTSGFGSEELFADGGPVRAEPRVGSRTPLPGGTAGGMSRDAIMAALNAAQMQAQPQKTGIGALPANPLTAPGAIVQAQMKDAGAYADGGPIRGPGGPRTDSIPARLSDGEHVFDAEAVTALGDGDNEKGQALLNEMRHRIKAHTAGKGRKH